MADWTRFWDSISKIGDSFQQVAMYDYQQKAEEARLERERTREDLRNQANWKNQFDQTKAASLEMENMRTENDVKTAQAKDQYMNMSKSVMGSPGYATQKVQAALSMDPAAMARIGVIDEGFSLLAAGQPISEMHQRAFDTLPSDARQGVGALQMQAKQLDAQLKDTETRTAYMKSMTDQDGKVSVANYVQLVTQARMLDDDKQKILADPQFRALIALKEDLGPGGKLPPNFMAQDQMFRARFELIRQRQEPLLEIIERIGTKLFPGDVQKTPPPDDSPLEGTVPAKEKSFGESAGNELKTLPERIGRDMGTGILAYGKTFGDGGLLGRLFGKKKEASADTRNDPNATTVPVEQSVGDFQTKLKRKYSIPANRNVYIAEGGKVMSMGLDGKMTLTNRQDLKTVAGPEDFLWDQDAGKMFKLSLYLGEVPGDNTLDEEDEIFR